MHNKNIALVNFGCRLNSYETQSLKQEIENKGFNLCGEDRADYVIINTCTVTNRADLKNKNTIRKIHEKNNSAKIIVTGCYASTDAEEIKNLPGVFSIINNQNKSQIPEYLLKNTNLISTPKDVFNYKTSYQKEKSRAHVKIQDGCNRACSYCKIPSARGKAISRSSLDILNETRALLDSGFREIILTGINIGSYKDESGKNLAHLLDKLCLIDKEFLIRISSIEPGKSVTELVPFFAKESKLCRFMHIPLQSGSSKILKNMQRGYSISKYSKIIDNLRKQCPEIHIGTDIITGYPGESDFEFKETAAFLNEMRFSNIHVFPFSRRNGTHIDDLLNQKTGLIETPSDEKKRRVSEILEIKEKSYNHYIKQTSGVKFRAIVERSSENGINALTENYVKLYCKTRVNEPRGSIINVSYGKNANTILL
ncbi:MAG: tRNA (N(6)-L-threonylcarbamoyladenosine(37)-C(2))-methylthiotransferase MtaB [Spirochaetia bacterium]|nr:tRNA (N(6)-L-threonylcarbamoyladenosine(37)-C(2))-methylthiotransferase MtaB [Spirochaetia bacterium]